MMEAEYYGGYGAGGMRQSEEARYLCCCGTMKSRKGAALVGVIELILMFLSLGLTLFAQWVPGIYGHVYSMPANDWISTTAWLVLTLFVSLALFAGLAANSASLLIPYLLYQVLLLLVCIVGCILTIVFLLANRYLVATTQWTYSSDYNADDLTITIYAALFVLTLLIQVGLQIWFITVVLSAYRDLNEGGTVGQGPYQVGGSSMPPPQVIYKQNTPVGTPQAYFGAQTSM